jgi:hypothetical protein
MAEDQQQEEAKFSDLPWSRRIPFVFIIVFILMLLVAAAGVVTGAGYKLFMAGFDWSSSW